MIKSGNCVIWLLRIVKCLRTGVIVPFTKEKGRGLNARTIEVSVCYAVTLVNKIHRLTEVLIDDEMCFRSRRKCIKSTFPLTK